MRIFGPAPLPLDHRLPLDAALDDAFAPLRARTATVGPARVRAAVRWSSPEPHKLGGLALLTRLSELTVAAAISAFVFGGVFASVGSVRTVPDISRDAVTAGGRMLNGRNAFQRPSSSQFADYRMTAGDLAVNAAIARRPVSAAPAYTVRDSEPFAGRP
ncbi:MAG TPA: hypothetical protein VGS17_06855 [Candidatus Limnocylindria bacterium]|nr:hypothetical protein [Candidatus Limnocylindria bacterium]